MLGHIKSGRTWTWAAFGKHPSARDFIRTGRESPLVSGFANWIDTGYKEVVSQKAVSQYPVAWRFWSKGAGSENLVCGLVKDSSDSLGRRYPLLIAGTGYLSNWQAWWDLLAFACEKPWEQLEYLSTRTFRDMKTLQESVINIMPPSPDWPLFSAKRNKLFKSPNISDPPASGPPDKTEGFICLDKKPSDDRFTLINYWHSALKSDNKSVPNAIFLGGTFERSYLAFFRRSLTKNDFIQLWTLCTAGSDREGYHV